MKVGDYNSRLTAIEPIPGARYPSEALWLFKCDCGNEVRTQARFVEKGKVLQCKVCVAKAQGKTRSESRPHKKKHPLYTTWLSMRSRCNNPNENNYHNYGGRGIKVCKRWDNFWLFVEDLGPKQDPTLTLHRINNDEGYSPENCCWATRLEQAANSRPKSRFWRRHL